MAKMRSSDVGVSMTRNAACLKLKSAHEYLSKRIPVLVALCLGRTSYNDT